MKKSYHSMIVPMNAAATARFRRELETRVSGFGNTVGATADSSRFPMTVPRPEMCLRIAPRSMILLDRLHRVAIFPQRPDAQRPRLRPAPRRHDRRVHVHRRGADLDFIRP